jgi:hypothetical protein
MHKVIRQDGNCKAPWMQLQASLTLVGEPALPAVIAYYFRAVA